MKREDMKAKFVWEDPLLLEQQRNVRLARVHVGRVGLQRSRELLLGLAHPCLVE